MAKQAAKTTTPAPAFAVGQVVSFLGYGQLEEGQEEIFAKGDQVTITAVGTDGSFTIASADGTKSDTAFDTEIEATAKPTRKKAVAAETPPAEPVAAAPATTKRSGKKTEAAPVAEAAPALKAGGKPKTGKQKNLAAAADTAPAVKATRKKAEAAAPVVKAPVEEAPIVITDTTAVQEAMKDSDALTAAKELVAQTEETFFTLGGVLAHIRYEGLYKQAGYDGRNGFADYVEKELGVRYRKAMQLVDIYQKVTSLGVDEKRLTALGWTKVREVVKILDQDNFDEVVEYVQAHTREEIIEHVKTEWVRATNDNQTGSAQPTERAKRTTYKFAAFDDQAVNIDAAIARAKELAGSDDVSVALIYIVNEWAQLVDAVPTTLQEDIKRIETKHNISLDLDFGTEGEEDAEGEDQEQAA